MTEQLASLNLLYSEVSDKINKNQNFMQSGQDKLVGFLGGLADVKSEAASLSAEKLTALARLEEIALAEKSLPKSLPTRETRKRNIRGSTSCCVKNGTGLIRI